MNPNATEFVPAFTMNPNAKEFVSKNTLDTLSLLSTAIAENVLFELNPVHKELLAQRALEEKIIKIPVITSVDDFEQVAQISTTDGVYELFWNGTHAILDNRISSWQFPDMTIRHILQCYFGNFTTDSPALDVPASYAPAIQLSLTLYDD